MSHEIDEALGNEERRGQIKNILSKYYREAAIDPQIDDKDVSGAISRTIDKLMKIHGDEKAIGRHKKLNMPASSNWLTNQDDLIAGEVTDDGSNPFDR